MRRWRTTALSREGVLYLDSSALVKLLVEEPGSDELASHLTDAGGAVKATSKLALVEVPRAVSVAGPSSGAEARMAAMELLDSLLLIDVDEELLRAASLLTSVPVRTLDAIHLASAEQCRADEVVAYDRRLAQAARARGLATYP